VWADPVAGAPEGTWTPPGVAACGDDSAARDGVVIDGRVDENVDPETAVRATGAVTGVAAWAPSGCAVDGRANACARWRLDAVDPAGCGVCAAVNPSRCGEGPAATPGVAVT